jgi:prolipoprotein diacylglyceryltransferase
MFHWGQYEYDILGIIRIWEGGMMFFGGFIGGFLAGMIYLKKQKISVLQVADIAAPAIAIGVFFTRIGCFLNGCCFGTPSTLPWAIKFPAHCVMGNKISCPLCCRSISCRRSNLTSHTNLYITLWSGTILLSE